VTAIIGVVSVLTQLLLVSFIIRRFSLTAALLVLPVAMAVSSSIYLLIPVLWAAALLTISDNSFSYSIHQTARETLYMPMSPDVKYKARWIWLALYAGRQFEVLASAEERARRQAA
jgi:AAA family ATP:ADP antiporter